MPTTTIDVYATKVRVIRNPPGTADDIDVFMDLPADGPVEFLPYPSTTFMYPIEYEGHSSTGFDFVPATPAGGTLVSIKPFAIAHVDGAQEAIDGSDFGMYPNPSFEPFLQSNHSRILVIDTFPVGADAGIIVGAEGFSPLSNDEYQSGWNNGQDGIAPTAHILLSAFGWRYEYDIAATGGVQPRRIFQRSR